MTTVNRLVLLQNSHDYKTMTKTDSKTSFVLLTLLLSHCVSELIDDKPEGLIAAVGDFNNDKYLDIVAINNDLKTLSVWYYKHQENSPDGSKINKGGSTIDPGAKEGEAIASVVPGDFNGDSTLDLAVFLHNKDMDNSVRLKMFLHDTSGSKTFESSSVPDEQPASPAPMDGQAGGTQTPGPDDVPDEEESEEEDSQAPRLKDEPFSVSAGRRLAGSGTLSPTPRTQSVSHPATG